LKRRNPTTHPILDFRFWILEKSLLTRWISGLESPIAIESSRFRFLELCEEWMSRTCYCTFPYCATPQLSLKKLEIFTPGVSWQALKIFLAQVVSLK
jgi:hypothetical protein